SSLTTAWTRARSRPTLGTLTSSTPCDTRCWRPIASQAFGRTEDSAQRRLFPRSLMDPAPSTWWVEMLKAIPSDGMNPLVSSVEPAARLGKDIVWQRTETDAARARDDTQRLLAKELSAADAVQIALLSNPGLQASYAELGIAEADLVQAGRV